MSGLGLALATLSSSPLTMWSNREKSPVCFSVLRRKEGEELLVATAMGIWCLARWWTRGGTFLKLVRHNLIFST